MVVLLVAYLASLLMRSPYDDWPWIDGWGLVVYELILSGLLLARGFTKRPGQAVPLVLGSAVLAWTLGDLVLTWEGWGGANVGTPSFADPFYVAFYPLAYAAIVLMLRREIKRMLPATWLDGAIAGLGAAAVCAAFAFHAVLRSLGGNASALGVAVNLVYPIGDVLLLALIVGGTAVLPGRRLAWWLFASACAVSAVGDTFNLFGSTDQVGIVVNEIAHPAAILLMSVSVWVPIGRRDLLHRAKTPGFLLPGAGALAGVAILVVGALQRLIPAVAIGLATATLAVAGLRLWLSARGLRALTEERHRRAVTDELTGLGNRYQLTSLLDAYFDDLVDTSTPPHALAFLFVDLDRFKEINDNFGHAAGDELLTQLGPRLMSSLRATDVLVRIGGDELGVVLMDSEPAYAAGLARRLTALLEQPFVLKGGVLVSISASIGIALAPDDASDSLGLIRCADVAMYRAKLGQQPFEIYRSDGDDGREQSHVRRDSDGALESRQLAFRYQP
jgi:diguanylate cyclase (GGDEF)-like protein